ncbi:hypothetical protein I7I48_11499 [Histoplasma ohiense]|nr:hypothetical protein I7I48_11499 [Histoplasma ohiense (nom. inval.)]
MNDDNYRSSFKWARPREASVESQNCRPIITVRFQVSLCSGFVFEFGFPRRMCEKRKKFDRTEHPCFCAENSSENNFNAVQLAPCLFYAYYPLLSNLGSPQVSGSVW